MDLGDILTKQQILSEMRATNRWEAIDELIQNLVATGRIKPEHQDAIAAVVKKREASMSTGIGFGIGIPHASTDLIGEVVGSLGRSRKGVNFEALDNQPVNLVMLFLVPQGQFQKHLHTLAHCQIAASRGVSPGPGTGPRPGCDAQSDSRSDPEMIPRVGLGVPCPPGEKELIHSNLAHTETRLTKLTA
jgi:mannitol/fructose-specific phosphotransferase system IIA component (Ntr-type)